MSLRDKIRNITADTAGADLFSKYGVVSNPFPSANQTSDNPHFRLGDADDMAETQIAAFIRDNRSQAVVVEGTQGVGKTNFLNHFEEEIASVSSELPGYYVVRYLADPENTFDGTIRRLFQELGSEHLKKLAEVIRLDSGQVQRARGQDVQTALYRLASGGQEVADVMMEWLLGLRLLKVHKESLGVQFRLDTVEAKTSALRDIIEVSTSSGILSGIFLLLDELEKQDGVLGPRAVVRYLSSIRAIIDALPRGLFLMIAVTPDALMRYSVALPALRGRLQNRIELQLLRELQEAKDLANFYMQMARQTAQRGRTEVGGYAEILSAKEIESCYDDLHELYERRSDDGVRQREFLHVLFMLAEKVISTGGDSQEDVV